MTNERSLYRTDDFARYNRRLCRRLNVCMLPTFEVAVGGLWFMNIRLMTIASVTLGFVILGSGVYIAE